MTDTPEGALAAATKAVRKATLKVPCPEDREIATAVLEAATPLLLAEQRKWDAAAHKAVSRARERITEAAQTGSVTVILTAVREGLDDIDQTIPEATDD